MHAETNTERYYHYYRNALSQTHCSCYVKVIPYLVTYMKTFWAGCCWWWEVGKKSQNRKKNPFEKKVKYVYGARAKGKWSEREQKETISRSKIYRYTKWNLLSLRQQTFTQTLLLLPPSSSSAYLNMYFHYVLALWSDFFSLSSNEGFLLFYLFAIAVRHIYHWQKPHTATIKSKPRTK